MYVCRKMKGADEMDKLWKDEVQQIRLEEAQRGGILSEEDSMASDSEKLMDLTDGESAIDVHGE